MSEKKQGFFSKLFGKRDKVETPQPEQEIKKAKELVEQTKSEQAQTVQTNPEKAIKKPTAKKKKPAAPKAKAKVGTKSKTKTKAKAKPAPKTKVKPEPFDAGPPETTPEWIEEHTPKPIAPKPVETKPVEKKSAKEKPKKQGWLSRLSSGLKRSSDNLSNNITSVFTKKKLDQATLDDLEDILIQADLGIDTALSITEALAKNKFDKEISAKDVQEILALEVEKTLEPVAKPLIIDTNKSPFVILMIGVNGSGKTTTIGKLAQKFSNEGKKVILAAGDTFRAAAIEQLEVWGKRTGAKVISKPAGSDASGLAYEAFQTAKDEKADILIIDTAGRLQNRVELMDELEKIIRVIKKIDETAPHATLLTLDATTGQNALNQVEIFSQKAGVTGLVMTKLDGTARGGILVAIAKKHALPVHYIGVGEGVEDLESFTAKDFAFIIADQ